MNSTLKVIYVIKFLALPWDCFPTCCGVFREGDRTGYWRDLTSGPLVTSDDKFMPEKSPKFGEEILIAKNWPSCSTVQQLLSFDWYSPKGPFWGEVDELSYIKEKPRLKYFQALSGAIESSSDSFPCMTWLYKVYCLGQPAFFLP